MKKHFDYIVIGTGPGGQEAALEAAKHGKSVAIIEKERHIGGACVHRGTIPSKTLRETAFNISKIKQSTIGFSFELPENTQIESLMTRKDIVLDAHVDYMMKHLEDKNITHYRGRASFVNEKEIQVMRINGDLEFLTAEKIVIATGSRPRHPENIPIDHENILDSDSILSMIYLPTSMTILGGGVISCEYATFFAVLGVKVTIIDTADRPLRFLEKELTDKFLADFEAMGGTYLGEEKIESVEWDGVSNVRTKLESGKIVDSAKLLVALGRLANIEILKPETVGIELSNRGHVLVNEFYQTNIDHIYAVGDIIGFPSLASCSLEQGRRAVDHSLGKMPKTDFSTIPMGIYTIPEISSVGLSQKEAEEHHDEVTVGYASFDQIARGQISGIQNGLLKLIADKEGKKLLGVHIIGEGATELIHLGQMALLADFDIEVFVENVMNFPTLAEAYRVAALEIQEKFHK